MTSLSTRMTFWPLALVVCLWCMAGSSIAKPATSEVPLKLALASQDYLDLQAILGKSLPGTPAEKAKVIDLLLQLLAEIDLPTLCNVIGNDTSFKEYNSMSTDNSISATPFASTRELPGTDDKITQQAPEDEDSENENNDVDSTPTKAGDGNSERNSLEKDNDERSKNQEAAKTTTNSTTSPETGNTDDDEENSSLNSIKVRPFKVVVRPWKKRFGSNNINTDGALPFPMRLLGRKRPFLNTRYIKNTKDLKKLGIPQKYSVALPFNLMRRRKISKLRSQGKKGNYFIRSVGIRKPKAELYSQSLVLGEWMNEHAPDDKFSSKNPTAKPGQIIRQAELAKENEIYDEDKDDSMIKDTKLGRRVMLVVRKGGKKGMKRRRVIYRKRKVNNPASRGPIQYSVVRQVSAPVAEGKDKAGQKIVKKRFFLPRESLKQRLYRAKGDRFGAGGHRIVRNGGSKRRFIPGRTRVLRVRAGPQSGAGKNSGHRRALYPDKQRVVMKAVGGGLDEYRNKGLAAYGEYADADEYDNHVDNKYTFSPSVEPTSSTDRVAPSTSTYSTDTTTTVKVPLNEVTDSNENVDEIDYIVPTVETKTGDDDETVESSETFDQSEEDLDVENMIEDEKLEEILDEEDNEIESYEDEDSLDNESPQEEQLDSSTEVYEAVSTTMSENVNSQMTDKTSTLSYQVTTESTLGNEINSTTHNIKTSNKSEVDNGKSANDSQVDNLPMENKVNEVANETRTVPPMVAYKGIASTPKAESTSTASTQSSSTSKLTVSLESTSMEDSNEVMMSSEANVDQSSESEEDPSQNTLPGVAEVTESAVVDELSSTEKAKGDENSEKRGATTTIENIMESIDEFYKNLFGTKEDENALAAHETASDNISHSDVTTESSAAIPNVENNIETTIRNNVTSSKPDTVVTETAKTVANTTGRTEIAIEPFMASLEKSLTGEREENENETESLPERTASDEETTTPTSTVKSVVNSPDEASLEEEDASEIEAISTDIKQSGQIETGEQYASLTKEQPHNNLTLEALMNITTRLNVTKVNQSETIKKLLEEGLKAQDSETTSATATETTKPEEKKLSDVVTEVKENISEPDEIVERITSAVLDATTSSSGAQDEFETEESKNERVIESATTKVEDKSNSEISSTEAASTVVVDSIQEIEDVTTLDDEGKVTKSSQIANSDYEKSTSGSHDSLDEGSNASNEPTLIKPTHIDFNNEDQTPINRPAGVSGPTESTPVVVSFDSTTPASKATSKSSTHKVVETETTTQLSNEGTNLKSNVISSNEDPQEADASDVDVISTAIRRPSQSEVGEEYASLTREQARANLTLETLMNITTKLDATKMNKSETVLQILQERNRALNSEEGDATDALPKVDDTTTAATEKTTTKTTPDATLTAKESTSEMAGEDASTSAPNPTSTTSEKTTTTTTASTTTTTTTTTTEATLEQEALPTMTSLSDEDKLISEVDKILNEIELNEDTTQDVTTEPTPEIENELTNSLSEEEEEVEGEEEEEESVKDSEDSNKLKATTKAPEEYNKGNAWEPVEIQKTFEDKLKPLGDFSYWKKPRTSLFHARFSDWIGPDGRKEYVDPKSNKIDLWKAYNIALTEGGKVDGNQKLQPQTFSGSGERNYLWNARTWTNSLTNPDLNPSLKNGDEHKNIQLKAGEQPGSHQSKEKDMKALPKDKNFNDDHIEDWGQRFSQGFYGRVYDQKRPSKSMFNPKVFSNQAFALGKEDFEQAYKKKAFDKSSLSSEFKTQSGHINSPQVIVSKPSSNDVSNDKDKSGVWLDKQAAFKNDKAAPKNTPLSSYSASREETKLGDVKTNTYSEQLSSATAFQSNEQLGPMGVAVPDDFDCPGLFGYFPDPVDCQSFFICSWKVPYRLSCPRGTRWNVELNVCDWAANVPCPHQDFRSSSAIDSAEY